MAVVPSQVNENFIKACRDGDLDNYTQLVGQAEVNYVSESGGWSGLKGQASEAHQSVLFSSWHQVHSAGHIDSL